MALAEEASVTVALPGSPPAGGILRFVPERLAQPGTRSRQRLEASVAEEAARRVGTMAILTALTVVGVAVLQDSLQSELAAAHQASLFRLSALFLVLASAGIAALQRLNGILAVNRELSLQKPVWDSHSLLDSRDSNEGKWFFDDQLLDRAGHNLEHLFTLHALLLPADAVRVAFRALHSDDRQLRGTAFEYLESATPAPTRHLLLPLLEADAGNRLRSAAADGKLAKLLAIRVRVNPTLKIDSRATEARR